VLGPFEDKIEELLRGKDWSKEKGRKVRRTARWVHRQLKKDGFTGAESTVRAYVRERFKQPRAACPIEHRPAAEVQFDFGQTVVKVAGGVTVIHFVGAVFPYSTRRFLFPYPAERQECLFDAMERVYQMAEGLTELATLDNTKLAVKKVLEGRRREETAAYERFRTALGVSPRHTNRAAGWEKGHVEGTVGWAKRQASRRTRPHLTFLFLYHSHAHSTIGGEGQKKILTGRRPAYHGGIGLLEGTCPVLHTEFVSRMELGRKRRQD
jgi:transposase